MAGGLSFYRWRVHRVNSSVDGGKSAGTGLGDGWPGRVGRRETEEEGGRER